MNSPYRRGHTSIEECPHINDILCRQDECPQIRDILCAIGMSLIICQKLLRIKIIVILLILKYNV